ncbi:MAG: hypothetical protein EAZ97_11630 [Bacteroidetes bacterium]|nr:MAG: hypothetical protein EAZ97_11630 [Bacteroidota bacterium]
MNTDWNDLLKASKEFFEKAKTFAAKTFFPVLEAKYLPEEIQNQLAILPQEFQEEFEFQFELESKSLVNSRNNAIAGAGIFFMADWYYPIIGIAGYWYYLKNKQIPNLAKDVLQSVVLRHRISSKQETQARPQGIHAKYASSTPLDRILPAQELFNDWAIIQDSHFSWNDQTTEKCYQLQNQYENAFSFVHQEVDKQMIYFVKEIPLNILDSQLHSEILHKGQPSEMITFQDLVFYKEQEREGVHYITNKSLAVRVWVFIDGQNKRVIRIIQEGKFCRSFLGQIV